MSGSRATAALRAGSSISSGKPQLDSATKTPLSIKTMPSAGTIIFPSSAGAWPAVISSISRSPIGTRQKRSEEHTSELQSPYDLVCRLLLEKKKKKKKKFNLSKNIKYTLL